MGASEFIFMDFLFESFVLFELLPEVGSSLVPGVEEFHEIRDVVGGQVLVGHGFSFFNRLFLFFSLELMNYELNIHILFVFAGIQDIGQIDFIKISALLLNNLIFKSVQRIIVILKLIFKAFMFFHKIKVFKYLFYVCLMTGRMSILC